MKNIFNYLKKIKKTVLLISAFILILCISLIRYYTGHELALSLLYLLPICIATWFAGKRAGVFMSLLSIILWLTADLMMGYSFSTPIIPYINETFRFIVFLFITLILSELKKRLMLEEELAMTDYLTGISNRRAFFKLANMQLRMIKRVLRPFSAIYMDIDRFKEINDQFGHNVGDVLLCLVAETIKQNTREIDITARLGGDEFIILLPETDSNEAILVAYKLQKKLSEQMDIHDWPVTFSMGVVTFHFAPDNVEDIIKKADLLMYDAKHSGKDMIKSRTLYLRDRAS